MSTPIEIPFRICFSDTPGKYLAAGSPGARGDAGHTVYRARDEEDARGFMRDNPGARMPCWARLEAKLND